jgi:lipid-binding SYLF domain-containing protein
MNRKARMTTGLFGILVMLCGLAAAADEFDETIALFKNAGQSATFFKDSYGYAVFPTIGKGGLVVGGGHGDGRVYRNGKYVGDTSMTQVSFGLQAGGQAYSQIIFFENQRAFDEFTKGSFEFGADASAVAIEAAATANVTTQGPTKSKSTDKEDAEAKNRGKYYNGFATFTIVKGGAMAEATVAGQKFSYKPRA